MRLLTSAVRLHAHSVCEHPVNRGVLPRLERPGLSPRYVGDVLDLLLPDADQETRLRAKEWAVFLRVLRDAALAPRASSALLNVDRVRGEVQIEVRRRLLSALRIVLDRALMAHLGPGRTLSWARPAGFSWEEAWHVLHRHQIAGQPSLAPPAPGACRAAVHAEWIAHLERLGMPRAELEIWRVRHVAAHQGAQAGGAAYQTLAERAAGDRELEAVALSARNGFIACLLDAYEWARARAHFSETEPVAGGDPHYRRLATWVHVALGDLDGAQRWGRELPPYAGTLSYGLSELRAARPEWAWALTGRSPEAEPRPGLPLPEGQGSELLRTCAEAGATALVVVGLRGSGAVEALCVDTRTKGAGKVSVWVEECLAAQVRPGELEYQMVVRDCGLVRYGELGAALGGALHAARVQAISVEPIKDSCGDLLGWLRLEFDSCLLPAQAKRRAWARSWAQILEATGSRPQGVVREPAPTRPDEVPVRHDLAELFEAMVARLGLRLRRRRWSAALLEREGGDQRLDVIVSGGEGLHGQLRDGDGGAAWRAANIGAPVVYGPGSGGMALHRRAESGVAMPMRRGSKVHGVLVIESEQKRDLDPEDVERLRERMEPWMTRVHHARFRVWHKEHFGESPCLPDDSAGFACFSSILRQAAVSDAPVALIGPAGHGRRLFARLLHWEAGHDARDLMEVRARSVLRLERCFEQLTLRGRPCTLVLSGVEQACAEVYEWIERTTATPGSVRLVAILAQQLLPLDRGTWARALQRSQLFIPAIKDRRAGLMQTLEQLVRREQGRLGGNPRVVSQTLLEFLWRQPWNGGFLELEACVEKLLVQVEPDSEDDESLALVLRCQGLRPVLRLPSLRPRKCDVVAALAATCLQSGRINKTRAARLLGWDPDTLVERMKDLSLGDQLAELPVSWGLYTTG